MPTFKWSAEGKVPKSLKPFLAQTSAAINFIFQLYKVPEEAVGYNTGGKDWLGSERIGGQVNFSTLVTDLERAANSVHCSG